MACHFAVSFVVNEMVRHWEHVDGLHVRSVVVSAAIFLRYEVGSVYQPIVGTTAAMPTALKAAAALRHCGMFKCTGLTVV